MASRTLSFLFILLVAIVGALGAVHPHHSHTFDATPLHGIPNMKLIDLLHFSSAHQSSTITDTLDRMHITPQNINGAILSNKGAFLRKSGNTWVGKIEDHAPVEEFTETQRDENVVNLVKADGQLFEMNLHKMEMGVSISGRIVYFADLTKLCLSLFQCK